MLLLAKCHARCTLAPNVAVRKAVVAAHSPRLACISLLSPDIGHGVDCLIRKRHHRDFFHPLGTETSPAMVRQPPWPYLS